MTDADRIRLAEAMGWTDIAMRSKARSMPNLQGCGPCHAVNGRGSIPNPFTDANDDYRVLQWIRQKAQSKPGIYSGKDKHRKWLRALNMEVAYIKDYRIGDYARAALKVLETVPDSES